MIREWLARKLAPEAFEDAERYAYLQRRLDDLQQWCGFDSPEIDRAVLWARKSLRVHFMPLAEFHEHCAAKRFDITHVGDISQFREELRARAKQRDAA